MVSSKRTILFVIIAGVALSWVSAPYWGRSGDDSPAISTAPLMFDEQQALQTTRAFVTLYPKRVLGTIEARQATGFLRDFLKRQGYEVAAPTYFDAIIAGRRQAGGNVVAFRPGALPGLLVVAAHFDTTRTTVQGAMDDGAGVGVMLELARVFSGSPLRHGLLLLATDGEEWGMLGASDFAQNYPRRGDITAALSLDFVSVGSLSELHLDTDGQRSGYAPGWLRRLAIQAAETQGLPVRSPAGFKELMQRALSISRTDQGPFLHAGIPAVNLGSASEDAALEARSYHSPADTIENLTPAGVGRFGRAAERILRSLDDMTGTPPGMDGAFRWGGNSYVAGWAMRLLQVLTFLPLIAMLCFSWLEIRRSLSAGAVLKETTLCLAWLVPFGLGYSLILFCRLMRVLPRNSLYPGPLGDPMLENPPWGILTGILAACVAVGIGLHYLARYLSRGFHTSFDTSRTVLTTFLLALVLLALFYDSYWATAFLALPALIWSSVGRGRSIGARLAGAVAIPAAGAVLYLGAFLAGRNLRSETDMIYYAVLGLSNGMLHWQGYALGSVAVMLGLRFFALQILPRK